MGALARAAQMDVGMATRQVGALVEAGLVTRDPDPADARVSLVAPTGTRAPGRGIAAGRGAGICSALSGWTAAELQEFDRLLTRFFDDSVGTPIDD